MLFLEQRGEFLVATIKHGLQTPKSPPITTIKKQQFQVLSSRILRKWFEKAPLFSNNLQTNVEFISKKHPN